MKNFLGALFVFLVGGAYAQISVTADMTQATAEAVPLHYGINFQRALAPSVANNADFKNRVNEINPGIVRYHAAEQTIAENDKSWVDFANQTWDSNKIDQVLSQKPTGAEVIITITGWPNFISENQRLPLDQIDEYAAFCAELVDIVNNQLGYDVTYWEPFNEKDKAGYDGPEQMAELADIFQACRAKMLEKDPAIQLVGGAFREPFQSNVQFFLDNLAPGDLDVWSHHQYGGGGSQGETDAERIAQIYNRPASIAEGLQVARTKLDDAGFDEVPVWLDEWNIYFSFNLDLANRYMISAVGGVFDALVYKRAIEEGNVDALMSWNAADGTYGKIASDFSQLNPGGHLLSVLREYGVGTVRPTNSSNPALIEGFTVQSEDGRALFALINRSQQTQQINFSAGGWTPPADVLQFTINQSGLNQATTTWSDITGSPTPLEADEILVFVTTGGGMISNQLPQIEGGGNKKVSAPYTTVDLTGSATDVDGTIVSYAWTQLDGPTASTGPTDQPTLTLSELQPDSQYAFQFDATDDQGGVSTDFVTVFTYDSLPGVAINGTSLENTYAGNTVNGVVQQTTADLGTQVSQQEELSLTFGGLEPSKTIFKTTLTDGAGLDLRQNATVSFFLKSTVDIGIRVKLLDLRGKEVNEEPFDLQIPGDNQYQEYTLDFGEALGPINGGVVNALQIVQSSPGTTAGTMVFDALRIGDVATSLDNVLPIASAGPNRIVTLPNDNPQVIRGFATDEDGAIDARQWAKISGPTATLEGENSAALTVSDLSEGEYVWEYTVTDDDGASAADQMRLVVVNNAGPARSSSTFLTNSFGGNQIDDAVQTTALGGKVTLSQDEELNLALEGINQFEKVYRTTLKEEAAIDISGTPLFSVDAKSTEAIRLRVKLFDNKGRQVDNSTFDLDVPGDETYRTYSLDFGGSFNGVDPTAITQIEFMSLTSASVSGTLTIDNVRLGIGRVSAEAGPNRLVTQPSGTVTLEGSDLEEDRVSLARRWQQISGPPAQLSGAETSKVLIEPSSAGEYVLAYQATDSDGVTASDQTRLYVVENSGPTAVGTTFLKNDFSGIIISDDAQTTAPSGPVTLTQNEELAITLNGIKLFEKAYRTELNNEATLDLSEDATFSVDIKSTETIRLRVKLFDNDGRQIDNFKFDLDIPGDSTYRTYTKNFANEFGNVDRRAIRALEFMSISNDAVNGVLTVDNLELGKATSSSTASESLSVVVSSSADDAEENNQGEVKLTSNDLDFRSDNLSAIRLALDVPAGAVISEATLNLMAKGNTSGANEIAFRAQTAGDASVFTTTTGDLSQRSTTSTSVRWTPGAWTDGETYSSPDLSVLIQTLVDQPGYQPGSHVVLTMTSDAANAQKRSARTYDYNGSEEGAPQLTISYLPPAAVGQRISASKEVTGKEVSSTPTDVLTYPNPARREVRFGRPADVRIFDGRGQEVLRGTQAERLDVTTLPAGLYIIKFATGQITKLIVE